MAVCFEAIRSAREVIAAFDNIASIRRDLLHFVFWKSDKVTHESIHDVRIPPKHSETRDNTTNKQRILIDGFIKEAKDDWIPTSGYDDECCHFFQCYDDGERSKYFFNRFVFKSHRIHAFEG